MHDPIAFLTQIRGTLLWVRNAKENGDCVPFAHKEWLDKNFQTAPWKWVGHNIVELSFSSSIGLSARIHCETQCLQARIPAGSVSGIIVTFVGFALSFNRTDQIETEVSYKKGPVPM